MTNKLLSWIMMFNQINRDHPSEAVSLTDENCEYYMDQMENLEADIEDMAMFAKYLSGRTEECTE